MATGDLRALFQDKKLLSLDQIKDGFYDYVMRTLAEIRAEKFNTYSPLGADSPDSFNIQFPCEGKTRDGHLLDLPSALASDIPFENSLNIPYYVGLRYNAIPDQVEANVRLGGKIQYRYLKDFIGELGHPDAVVDLGSGDLQFTVNGVLESGVKHSGRECQVWLDEPVSLSLAFASGTVVYSAPDNKVTVSSYLGQLTPSTDPDDYWVFIPGATVRRNADLRMESEYLPLGVVTGAGAGNTPTVFDSTIQLRFTEIEVEEVEGLPFGDNTYSAEWISAGIGTNPIRFGNNLLVRTAWSYYDYPGTHTYYRLWLFDGAAWTKIREIDTAVEATGRILCAGVYKGEVHTVEYHPADSAYSLWKWNGATWTKIHTFTSPNGYIADMAEYGGELHLLQWNILTNLKTWRWNGSTMTLGLDVAVGTHYYYKIAVAQGRIWFLGSAQTDPNGAPHYYYNGSTYGDSFSESGFKSTFVWNGAGAASGLGRDELRIVGAGNTYPPSYSMEIRSAAGAWRTEIFGWPSGGALRTYDHIRDFGFTVRKQPGAFVMELGMQDFEFDSFSTLFAIGTSLMRFTDPTYAALCKTPQAGGCVYLSTHFERTEDPGGPGERLVIFPKLYRIKNI